MGAIYVDYGYKQCKKFVEERLFKSFIDLDMVAENEVNFKSKLIEWCQKNRMEPEFILISEILSSSYKHVFESQLSINGKYVCEATGASKKESQQNASRAAIQQIQSNPELINYLKLITKTEEIIIHPEAEQTTESFVQ